MTELTEQLGYGSDDSVVIISCNGLGQSHAANEGCYRSVRDGIATSASLMMPCCWSRVAAIDYRGEDVGIDLTLNAEYERYRWGPLTSAPSLLDGDGGFPRTVTDMWDHADLDEVRRECRAQIERAVLWGIDVTHLGNHLHALQMRPEFFDVYLDLAVEFRLPMRLEGPAVETKAGFRFRSVASEEGVVFPDHVAGLSVGVDEAAVADFVEALPPGVTELHLRPGLDTPELRAISDDYAARTQALDMLGQGSSLDSALASLGVTRIGWRALKALMA